MSDHSEVRSEVQGEVFATESRASAPKRAREGVAECPAPGSNRGAGFTKGQGQGSLVVDGEIGIHWLQGTVPNDVVEKVRDYLADLLGGPESWAAAVCGYERGCTWAGGGRVCWDESPDRTHHKGRALVVLDGSTLERLSKPEIESFIYQLGEWGFACTRIDEYYDDFDRLKCPHEIEAEAGQLHNFSGFLEVKAIRPYRFGVDGKVFTGDSVYFGSRQSEKFLRIYDKRLESEGQRDCIRYELELKGGKARLSFARLVKLIREDGDIVRELGSHIGGCIDFVVRTGEKNVERLVRFDWWAKIVERLGRVRLRVARLVATLRQVRQWVDKSVAPSLVVLREFYRAQGDKGLFWLQDVLADAKGRLSRRHQSMLARALAELQPAIPF